MIRAADQEIRQRVAAWPGVAVLPHRFGGIEFRLGRKELGHLHGRHLLDVPFPLSVRNGLVASGRALPHHVLPESGWISFRISTEADIESAIDLLRQSYELAHEQQDKRKRAGGRET